MRLEKYRYAQSLNFVTRAQLQRLLLGKVTQVYVVCVRCAGELQFSGGRNYHLTDTFLREQLSVVGLPEASLYQLFRGV